MSVLGKLIDVTIDVIKVPVAVVKDVALDERETSNKVNDVFSDIEDAFDDFFSGDWF